MSLPLTREHTTAVVDTLEAFGIAVGDGHAPPQKPPYVIVWPIAGGGSTGVLAAPDDDASLVYQVTCVGYSREQAQWLADKALALLEGNISVLGRFIPRVMLDMHGGVHRDDNVTPPLYYSQPRFRLLSTPA